MVPSDTSRSLKTIAGNCENKMYYIKHRDEVIKALMDAAKELDDLQEVNDNLRTKNSDLRDFNNSVSSLTTCTTCSKEFCIDEPRTYLGEPPRYNCIFYRSEGDGLK